ncbi:hypothetical protein LCGC14_0390040 [marine sediment metagenome]|uniref:Uncharacterized protein n=1 Tax=marine sediment metagenome TaxID=412755 RepID=A0A0F9THU7_9ZZZZ
MSRGGFKVNKNSYEYARSERVDWLDTFADEYAKTTKGKSAVEVARERSQISIHDQVSSIVSDTQHATVESKVQDMQERAGLTDYLKRMAADDTDDQEDVVVFAKFGPKMQDDILSFIKHKISAYRGQTTVPALQHDVLDTFSQHGIQPQDVNNEDVACCISALIVDELKMNPPTDVSSPDLGRVDNFESDDNEVDFFEGIMPATG